MAFYVPAQRQLLPRPSVDRLGLALMEAEKHFPGKAEAGYSWIIP